jgi:hypothetical protein
MDQARRNGFFNDSGEIVNWSMLASAPPTDFLREDGFYFAVDRDFAAYYECYAKHRGGVSSVVVIHFIVPNQMVESLSATQLQKTYWPSAEWKNLIWHYRTRRFRFPAELRKFKQAHLIIGTIATKPSKVYQRMDSSEQIDDRCLLKTNQGRNAIQYVFRGEEGEEFLERLSSERLSVHPVSTAEFLRWQEEQGADSD